MKDRPLIQPIISTSRCRLTQKGRLHMDPARAAPQMASSRRPVQLNPTGRYVLEHCDGLHTVGEVASGLARAWPADESRVVADVLAFLESRRTQGFVEMDDRDD